jgi:hypothetical protein
LQVNVLSVTGFSSGAYLKQSAKNLATHDDFEKLLVEQTRTTQAVKETEARIVEREWDRQRRWEFARDSLVAAVQASWNTVEALQRVSNAHRTGKNRERLEELKEALGESSHRLIGALQVAKLSCGDQIRGDIYTLELAISLAAATLNNEQWDEWERCEERIVKAEESLRNSIQIKLGLEI